MTFFINNNTLSNLPFGFGAKKVAKRHNISTLPMHERIKTDVFEGNCSSIRFCAEDIEKMANMSVKEKLEFIKTLKKQGKFIKD